MQFMYSSLEKIVKNRAGNDFKYLTEEFGSKIWNFFFKKVLILISTWTVFKDLMKKNCLIDNVFMALKKMEQLMKMVEN